MPWSCSSRWIRLLLDEAHRCGLPAGWLAARGASSSLLEQSRVPYTLEREIFRDMYALEPGFGVTMAGAMATASILPRFHFVLASAGTLAESIDLLIRLSPVLSSGTRFVGRRHEDLMEISCIQVAPGDELLPAHAEFIAMRLAQVVARATSARAERPVEVQRLWFRHRESYASAKLRAKFGERVRFSQLRDSVWLRVADLGRPLAESEPRLGRILENALGDELRELPALSFAERVRVEVAVALAFDVPSADDVAARLGVAPRTMVRQLGEAGTSFTKMLLDLRMERAHSWLAHGETVASVATLSHYSEVPALWRAYRRHFGRGPGRAASLGDAERELIAGEDDAPQVGGGVEGDDGVEGDGGGASDGGASDGGGSDGGGAER